MAELRPRKENSMSSLTGMIYELSKWIDTGAIAEHIILMERVETVEQAKEVWLNFLATELADGLERSANAVLQR